MDRTNMNNSDHSRHPGRRDRPFSGDGSGHSASHLEAARKNLGDLECEDQSLFQPRTSLSRTPPGVQRPDSEPWCETSPNRGKVCKQSIDRVVSPKLKHFDTDFPARRHSSPEDLQPERTINTRSKRRLESQEIFSSPSLRDSRPLALRLTDLADNSETKLPPTKKPKQKSEGKKKKKPVQSIGANRYVQEACNINRTLVNFISAPEKKINKSNQEHIRTNIERLCEIIATLSEELHGVVNTQRCENDEHQTVDANGMDMIRESDMSTEYLVGSSGESKPTPVTAEILRHVLPAINCVMEKLSNNMITKINKIANIALQPSQIVNETSQTTPSTNKLRSRNGKSLLGHPEQEASTIVGEETYASIIQHADRRKRLQTKMMNNQPKQGRESPPQEQPHDDKGEWTIVRARTQNQRKKARRPGLVRADLKQLVPEAIVNSIEAKTNATTVTMNVDIDPSSSGDIDAAAKAAKLVDIIQIDPNELGDQVQKVLIMRDGRLRIQTRDHNGAETLKQALEKINNEEVAVRCQIQQPRQPRIAIRGIPQTWTQDQIIVLIKKAMGTQTTAAADNIRPLFRRGPRNSPTTTWVVAVGPNIRNQIISSKQIKYGLISFGCSDYIELPRCYKCQRIGHIAKKCHEEEECCLWCAEKGHSAQACPNAGKKARCRNCATMSLRDDHPANDPRCQAHVRIMAANIKKTGYG